MATSMRVEGRLEGSRNFRSWKHRLQMILDENDLLEHVTVGVPEPDEAEQKTKHKKNEKKAKGIMLDLVKDYLIPLISELQTTRHMHEALNRLYESKDISLNLTLRNQLRNMKMDNSESVTSYLMRVSQIRDQLAAIGDVISDKELVTTTLNRFPTFGFLLYECVQESSYPSLISYGQIAHMKNLDLQTNIRDSLLTKRKLL
jgi:hypothetical protein